MRDTSAHGIVPLPMLTRTLSWRVCQPVAGVICIFRSPCAMRVRWGKIAWVRPANSIRSGAIFVLVRMKIAPGRMEFAGLTQAIFPQRTRIAHGERKMQITPATGWQTLQLKVRVSIGNGTMPCADVSRIVKDRALGIKLTYKLRHVLHEMVKSLYRKLLASACVGRIETGSLHLGAAETA